MSTTAKLLYKPLSIGTSVLGGVLAGAVFNRIWNRVSTQAGDRPGTALSGAPDPKNLQRSTGEVIAAAALQGLVFGVVRAAIDRAGAKGFAALTHENPTS